MSVCVCVCVCMCVCMCVHVCVGVYMCVYECGWVGGVWVCGWVCMPTSIPRGMTYLTCGQHARVHVAGFTLSKDHFQQCSADTPLINHWSIRVFHAAKWTNNRHTPCLVGTRNEQKHATAFLRNPKKKSRKICFPRTSSNY